MYILIAMDYDWSKVIAISKDKSKLEAIIKDSDAKWKEYEAVVKKINKENDQIWKDYGLALESWLKNNLNAIRNVNYLIHKDFNNSVGIQEWQDINTGDDLPENVILATKNKIIKKAVQARLLSNHPCFEGNLQTFGIIYALTDKNPPAPPVLKPNVLMNEPIYPESYYQIQEAEEI